MIDETGPAALAAWSSDVYTTRDIKPATPLLGPLSRGCITLLCGPRGVGKSWLALALAHTVARGGTLGAWRCRKPHHVVFVDVAGSEAVLRERLIALAPDRPPPSLIVVPGDAQTGGLPDLSSESGRKGFDELTTDADLVVIDGVSALVRKCRGVGARWAALEDWLRSLRRRHCAVLLVDTKEPKMITDLADVALKVERPADGVREGDLRLQAKLLCARSSLDCRRFELRLTLRAGGAVWHYVDDIDHRAIMAYRLDRQDYSSREIAKLLNVSPATAWRLVTRGERLPAHIRDGIDLEVPIPERPKQKSALAKLLLKTLLPREKEGPVAKRREDEGPAAPETGDVSARGESPSPSPLPRERVPEAAAARKAPALQTPQRREAVKQFAPASLDDVPTDLVVAACLVRRRATVGSPSDALAAFSYDELIGAARARLSARVLNRRLAYAFASDRSTSRAQ